MSIIKLLLLASLVRIMTTYRKPNRLFRAVPILFVDFLRPILTTSSVAALLAPDHLMVWGIYFQWKTKIASQGPLQVNSHHRLS